MALTTVLSSQIVVKPKDLETLETDQRDLLTDLVVENRTLRHALEGTDMAVPLDEPVR